jgi:hypothetical protein
MITTLIVLATLIAAPLLFGVLLAVGLVGIMALYFGPEWVRGLVSPPNSARSPAPGCPAGQRFAAAR